MACLYGGIPSTAFPTPSSSRRNLFVPSSSKCKYLLELLQECPTTFGKYVYPSTYQSNCVESLHGKTVEDPFRWLEDPDDARTTDWVRRQCTCTDAYFSTLKESKAIVKKELSATWNFAISEHLESSQRYFWWQIALGRWSRVCDIENWSRY